MTVTVADVLAHHGIKGQKWGIRRNRPSRSTGNSHVSEDHKNAQEAKALAKKHGAKALTNKQLQDLITRMNLEKQYASVAPTPKGVKFLKAGGKFTGDIILNVGKAQATRLASDHVTKLVGAVLKK